MISFGSAFDNTKTIGPEALKVEYIFLLLNKKLVKTTAFDMII